MSSERRAPANLPDGKRGWHAELTVLLNYVLERELRTRLSAPDERHLAGVLEGLGSLGSLRAIAELVYRDHPARSDGSRRLSRVRQVHEALAAAARPGGALDARVRALIEIREPLELLLREARGDGASSASASPGLVAALEADLQLELRRLAHFEEMLAQLERMLRLDHLLLPWSRRRAAARFQESYALHGRRFGFAEPRLLWSRGGIRGTILRLRSEVRRLEERLRALRERIYRPSYQAYATDDLRADLELGQIQPILERLAEPGLQALEQARDLYVHALERRGTDLTLLRETVQIEAQLAEEEASSAEPETARWAG